MYQILAEAAQRESQEKDIHINKQLLAIEEKDSSIATIKKELNESREAVIELQKQVIEAKTLTFDQYIYIGTTCTMAGDKIFKIGGVGSYDDLKRRLASYQTSHSADDPFMFIYIAAVSDFQHVEKRIIQSIGEYRQNPKTNKEMYKLPQGYHQRPARKNKQQPAIPAEDAKQEPEDPIKTIINTGINNLPTSKNKS